MKRLLAAIILICAFAVLAASAAGRDFSRASHLLAEASRLIAGGHYAAAADSLEQARSLKGLPSVTRTEIDCGLLRATIGLGDYSTARRLYHEAMSDSYDDITDDMLRLNASELYFAAGDYDAALNVLDSIVSPRYATTRDIHRSRALTMLERYDDAVTLLTDGIARIGEDDPAYPLLVQNRGYALWSCGRLAGAVSDLAEAVRLVPESADRYSIMANLALAESEAGNHVSALKHINTAVAHLDEASPDGIIARRKRAEILARAGRTAESRAAFSRYFDSERRLLLDNLDEMTPSQRLNYWTKVKPLLSRSFILGDAAAGFLFDVAMFRRQTSLIGMRDTEALRRQLTTTSATLRRSLAPDEAVVEIVSYESGRNTVSYAAIILPKRGRARFVRLLDQNDIYRAETVGSNSIYNALKSESPSDKNLLYSDSILGNLVWRPIVKALPSGTRRIYIAPEGIFHLWAIENMPFDGCDSLEIHRISSTAALALRDKSPKTGIGSRRLLVGGLDYDARLRDSIAGKPDRQSADHIRSHTGSAMRFSYLKGTRDEVDSIAAAAASVCDIRHIADEATVKKILPGYDIVHIATHGYSLNFGLRRRPQFLADSVAIDRSLLGAGLALTGANTSAGSDNREDALLSAREICDLDLSGVDFVVLSACQTAKGDVSDEGAAGLVRGLKNAGVKTVMASLWCVDDRSTMLFMQEFYRLLDSGASKHEAYTGAQRRLRHEPTKIPYRRFSPAIMARERSTSYRILPPFDAPYYWAPFILIDDF